MTPGAPVAGVPCYRAPMWILSVGVALAQQPACEPASVQGWEAALDAGEESLRTGAIARASALLERTEEQLRCVVEVVPEPLMVRLGRLRAYEHMIDVDAIEAQRWLGLSLSLDPRGRWPSWVPDAHVARTLEAPEVVIGRADGGLAVPEGGGVFLDGRYLVEPVAQSEVPHLLQVAGADGVVTQAWWIDGAAFPPEVLGPAVPVPPAPLWFTDPVDPAALRRQRRARRLESAGSLALLSGALFGSAWLARTAYDAHPTDGLRTVVNGTTAASGAAGGLAIGAAIWAVGT